MIAFLDVPLKEEWRGITRVFKGIPLFTEFFCLISNACALFYFSESDPASGTGEINPEDY